MANNLDAIKKLLVTGLGAIFMSEEGILKMLSDLKLPRDAKNYLLTAAQKRKEDLTRVISNELKNFLQHINLHEELRKALDGMSLDVAATIHIKKGRPEIHVTQSHVARTKARSRSSNSV